MSTAIRVDRLLKRYGEKVAVDGISFEVRRGEIFGMVGPNGAGKTTTIECVEGLRRPDAGGIQVLGVEPGGSDRRLRARIGIQLQESSLPPRLRVGEAMKLFASFYPRSVAPDTLLARLGLQEKSSAYFGSLSGGQKQRLFIALALINDPELVFLDELTTGLDPHARRSMWGLVEGVRKRGKTVFLTTHFMEEAERLCDRVAILDRAKIVALDAPGSLVQRYGGGSRILLRTATPADQAILRGVDGVLAATSREDALLVSAVGTRVLGPLLARLSDSGVEVTDVRTEQATLEDVFLHLTGRAMAEGKETA